MLRQRGLQRAHFEDTKTPIKRTKLLAERQLGRGTRGRKTWAAGAALQAAAIPAAGVGLYRMAKPSDVHKKDSVITSGLKGMSDAFEDRLESQRTAPPSLTLRNAAQTAGASLAGGGLAAAAMRGRKIGPLSRSAAISTAGVAAGTASLPAQAKMLERKTGGEYTITPTGVKRKKKAPRRPSHDATMIDTKSGTMIPGGVRKADDDPGAKYSRTQRRAMVAGAGGAPIVGDAVQAGAAAGLAAPPYRKRTAAEVFAANNAGNLVGAGAGALGAARLAQSSASARTKMENANAAVERGKSRVADKVPQVARDKYSTASSKLAPASPKRLLSKVPTGAAGRLIARQPAAAAVGGLAGAMVGGQVGMHAAYTRAMNRDDRYRDANRMARRGTTQVAKDDSNMSRREKSDLAHKKQKAAVLSVIAGGAGMGALTATGATGLIRRVPKTSKVRRPLSRIEPHAEKVKTPLLAVSSGVGGYSSMNFAGMQRQEARNLDPKINKALIPSKRPRRPSVRSSHIRRVRTPSGVVRTSSVRGSLR